MRSSAAYAAHEQLARSFINPFAHIERNHSIYFSPYGFHFYFAYSFFIKILYSKNQ